MPCNSDYMEPTDIELHLRETAQLLVWLCGKLGRTVAGDLSCTANATYADRDYTAELCEVMATMGEVGVSRLFAGNYKSRECRKLMDWWETHRKADAARIAKERKRAKLDELVERAVAKLTDKELDALRRRVL